MALFSRRKKSVDDDVPVTEAVSVETDGAAAEDQSGRPRPADEPAADRPAADRSPQEDAGGGAAPSVGISVQAFRGVGAEAGPQVSLPAEDDAPQSAAAAPQPAAAAPSQRPAAPAKRRLPLAAALPPEQTESVPGMKDNVLLREALAELEEGATNEQLLGVLRQTLQSHLYLRVNGDARQQIADGGQLSIAVIRDGDRSFMLAFSSAAAVRAAVQREQNPIATSAIAQPTGAVLRQVIDGGFSGMVLDNASAPHRAVFPIEVLTKALEQADPEMTVKNLLAAPRQADTAAKVGQALGATRMWVAVNEGGDGRQPGIAEAQTPDGKRFLQLFSHPLEVVALGRGDRPLPFAPAQLAKVLSSHTEIAGVLVDAAGPSIIVERDALAPVLVHAVDLGD